MTQPIKTVLIGAGIRGMDCYAPYALHHPDDLQVVAVAEPDPKSRFRFAEHYNISSAFQFESWEPLFDKGILGEAALICTQDQMHTQPALAALKIGYDVLLEKPMAPTLVDCWQLSITSFSEFLEAFQ